MAEYRQGGIVREQILFIAIKDKNLWRVMISHVIKGHNTKEVQKGPKVLLTIHNIIYFRWLKSAPTV